MNGTSYEHGHCDSSKPTATVEEIESVEEGVNGFPPWRWSGEAAAVVEKQSDVMMRFEEWSC